MERIAIGDETVAGVTVTRKTPGSPAARLILTGKQPGRTTLMVWEKGQSAATAYTLDVQRRDGQKMLGLQSWIALPAGSEEIAPSFQHYGADALPTVTESGSLS